MSLDPSAAANDDKGDATPEDLVATIDQCAKEARERRGAWVEEGNICYGFVASHQWSDEDLKILSDAGRPAVTIPLVGPVIDVVAGLEVTNRQEVQYLQREEGDAGADEVLTGAGNWVRDECNAEDEESEAFLDMAICGEGWTETRLDYEYDADGMILTERVDPFEMLPDPRSVKKNYRDAEYLIREKMVPISWVKETWPEKAEDLEAWEALSEDREFSGESHLNIAGDQYRAPNQATNTDKPNRGQCKLVEYQYKKRVPFFRIQDPQTGETTELTPDQHKQVQERAQAMLGTKLKSVRQTKCIYHRAFKVGPVLLERNKCPDPASFTYKAMTAKRDRKKGCWYGIVRPMLDAQRWVNKFFSQSMHILNTNAKGGVIAEKTAFDDQAAFEASWAKSDKVTIVRDGALTANRIQPKVPPPFPSELGKLLEFCVAMVYKVSGISPEMQGAVDREQAAVLEYQRKQAGVTILATLFDALRKYRKEQGKTMLYLLSNYLSDGRLIRIVGKQGAKYVPLMRQKDFAKYDVVIDDAPSSPNQKEKTWVILQSLLPILIKAGIQVPPQVLEYLPLPQSLLDAIKKPDPQAAQEAQQMKQMAIAEKQAEIDKTNAEAKKAEAEAMAKMTDAGLKRAEIQGQDQAMQQKLITDTITTQKKAELARWEAEQQMALEIWKAKEKAALDRQLAEQSASLDMQKAQVEVGLKRETAESDMAIQKEKLKGEQDAKGITDVRKGNEVAAGIKDKIEFLQKQYEDLKETLEAPVVIDRDAKGKATGARRVKKAKAA